jgi:hypothetical protein
MTDADRQLNALMGNGRYREAPEQGFPERL